MIDARVSRSYSPLRHWCFPKPVEWRGSEAAYRLVTTFAASDDLVQEFAFNPHLGQFTRSIQGVFVSKKSQKRRSEMLPVLDPDAAGVDIGAEELFVAVPPDRDSQPVRRCRSSKLFLRKFYAASDQQ